MPFVLVTKSCSFFKDVGFQDMLRGSAASSLLGRPELQSLTGLQVPTLDNSGGRGRETAAQWRVLGDPMPLEGQRAQTDLPPSWIALRGLEEGPAVCALSASLSSSDVMEFENRHI